MKWIAGGLVGGGRKQTKARSQNALIMGGPSALTAGSARYGWNFLFREFLGRGNWDGYWKGVLKAWEVDKKVFLAL